MSNTQALKAALGEVDITPPLGTQLAGWLDVARPAQTVRDPVFARMLVVECDGRRIGFISLDLLSIRGSDVVDIRDRIGEAADIPPGHLMIGATHNHAGPAIVSIGPFRREETYLEGLKQTLTRLADETVGRLEPAEIGVGVGFEGRLSFNRRWVMKNGLVKTQPGVANPDVLYCEGPIDPQLGVVCIRKPKGDPLGYLVNWGCHPVHVYDMKTVTASWPGALAREIWERQGVPCLVLNGAFGNVHTANWVDPDYRDSPERTGKLLAEDVLRVTERLTFSNRIELASARELLEAPLRDISEMEIDEAKRILAGESVPVRPGVQRYGQATTYAASVLQLVERKKERNFSRAEVQAIRFGPALFAGLAAEAFVETGLRIKLGSPFNPTFVVGAANGMVGYSPLPENYRRGGYECTTAHWSKVAPEAAERMIASAIKLSRELAV